MNPIPNPDSWMDVFTILAAAMIVGLPGLVASVRNHRGIKEIRAQNEAIVGQVVNGHGDQPPLRADIDRANTALEKHGAALEQQGATIQRLVVHVTGLREDIATEHRGRREQVKELREDVDARLTELHRRMDR